jgi:hypothetical protein
MSIPFYLIGKAHEILDTAPILPKFFFRQVVRVDMQTTMNQCRDPAFIAAFVIHRKTVN